MATNELTDIIKAGDQICNLILIVDKDGNPIPRIIEYNNLTKEAVVIKTDEKGLCVRNETGTSLVTENKVLEGSRIMFNVYKAINTETNGTDIAS